MIDAAAILPNAWAELGTIERGRAETSVASGATCGLSLDRMAAIGGSAELYAIEESPQGEPVDWAFAVAYLEDEIRVACDRRRAVTVAAGIGGGIALITTIYYLTK